MAQSLRQKTIILTGNNAPQEVLPANALYVVVVECELPVVAVRVTRLNRNSK
jgi:hypothetical protein